MANMQHVFGIIDKPQTLEDKIQALADEAVEAAQRPSEDDRLKTVPVWYKATVLFEFNLGFLCISYPQVTPLRDTIMDVFKQEVIKRFPS